MQGKNGVEQPLTLYYSILNSNAWMRQLQLIFIQALSMAGEPKFTCCCHKTNENKRLSIITQISVSMKKKSSNKLVWSNRRYSVYCTR